VHERLEAERKREEANKQADPLPVVYADGHIDPDEPTVNGFAMGVGPGVSFGNELFRRQGVPIGLIPAAHGGSSMAQWSPLLHEDGSSLFGAMLLSVQAAGGAIAGVLWYQGESESDTNKPYTYDAELTRLFAAMRDRLGTPDLRIIVVQLGRYAHPQRAVDFDLLWSRLRESQRLCLAASAVVTAVDLDLDDPIHIGTSGQLRLGRRLARAAAGAPCLKLAGVATARAGLAVDVRFSGVVGRLSAKGERVSGFSIRSGAGVDQRLIFAADPLPEGDGFRLRLSRHLQKGEQLWYGYGADPFCNAVDDEDMAVPAFGPVELAVT
jgi:sialate O-acetylesterase